MSACILDASALVAYLHDEEGAEEVADALAATAAVSAANWAEVLSKLADGGSDPRAVVSDLQEQGLLHGLLEVVPLTPDDAVLIAELRRHTRKRGLSLGDRACLALALRLELPALTADRECLDLENVEADIRFIRQ